MELFIGQTTTIYDFPNEMNDEMDENIDNTDTHCKESQCIKKYSCNKLVDKLKTVYKNTSTPIKVLIILHLFLIIICIIEFLSTQLIQDELIVLRVELILSIIYYSVYISTWIYWCYNTNI
jgi:hypothetical protein